MSDQDEPTVIRHIDKAAKRRLKRSKFALVSFALLFVNFPIFIASDVIGIVEFSLPTIQTEARVTQVESYGPWHHQTQFTYNAPDGSQQHESSWSTLHPQYENGDRVAAEFQESDFEHARIIGQRKGTFALWQAGLLPLVALVLYILSLFIALKKIRLARRGTLVEAQVSGDALVFEIIRYKPDAGYRDQAGQRTKVHIPIPETLPQPEDGQSQWLVYDPNHPEHALILESYGLFLDGATLSAKSQRRFPFLAVFVPYFVFSLMLLAYYLGVRS